jgi:diacylglycerol kinase (ATP)
MPKYKIIVNPAAGNGNGQRSIPQIKKTLAKHNLEYDLVVSERPGHAIELARQAALAGFDTVVAAGGDGTANEVINGLMEAKGAGADQVALGVLCVGRGNDFAQGAGVPYNLEAGCQALAEGYRRKIDIGRVYGGLYPQGRYFGNCVGVGFDAIGTIEVSKMPRMGGFLSFLIAVLKTIFLYNNAPISTVQYDGQAITQPSLLISVMNGRRLGGGFWMAPHSQPDDGLFDLCIAHQVSQWEIFRLIPRFLRGTQASHPAIRSGQAAQVKIFTQEGVLPAQTDGEILCIDGQHLEIELLPRQIEVICQKPGTTG